MLLSLVAAAEPVVAQPVAPELGFVAGPGVEPVQFFRSDRPDYKPRRQDRGPGILRFLFGKQRQPEYAPSPRVDYYEPDAVRPRQPQSQKPNRQRRDRTAVAPAPKVVPVEKADDARRVLVVGDFLATALAKGLTASWLQQADERAIDRTNGASGLVRDDYHDWKSAIPALVESERPGAIVAMIGANDRQAIDVPTDTADASAGASAEVGSDSWRAAYASRVAALADALKATGKPIFWVGLPPVKSAAVSQDYSALNGIIRDTLDAKGIRFVDTWNGFVDEGGKFASSGPDINGQAAQLRAGDGLGFTRAGQRKLAYFVEQAMGEMDAGTSASLPLAAAPTPSVEIGPSIGPMTPMDQITLAGSGELAGGAGSATVAAAGTARPAPPSAPTAPAGRADFYQWPPPASPPATPAAPSTP